MTNRSRVLRALTLLVAGASLAGCVAYPVGYGYGGGYGGPAYRSYAYSAPAYGYRGHGYGHGGYYGRGGWR